MKLKPESLVLLDSNICLYRTLALITPEIYPRGELEDSCKKIHFITNSCKSEVKVTDVVLNELSNNQILFSEIYYFWKKKLHSSRLYKVQEMTRKAEKSISKFFLRYGLDNKTLALISNHKNHMAGIDNFYLAHLAKLKELTQKKITDLDASETKRKLVQRPNNFPEENDRILLSQAIELKAVLNKEVYIFSHDGDFTEFKNEIFSKFSISVIDIGDDIQQE